MKETLSIPYVEGKKTFEIDGANLLGDLFPEIPSGIARAQEEETLKVLFGQPQDEEAAPPGMRRHIMRRHIPPSIAEEAGREAGSGSTEPPLPETGLE